MKNPNTNRNEKTLTNKSVINTHRAWEVNWYPFQVQALAAQTLSIKGREKVGDRSDVLICAFTQDHVEESLLHQQVLRIDPQNWQIRSDLGCIPMGPPLAPNSVLYSVQAQLHHKQLTGWSCTGVHDQAPWMSFKQGTTFGHLPRFSSWLLDIWRWKKLMLGWQRFL